MSTKIKYGLKEFEKQYGPFTFGKMIESYRLCDELSQKQFAKKLGISAASLCDLELQVASRSHLAILHLK